MAGWRKVNPVVGEVGYKSTTDDKYILVFKSGRVWFGNNKGGSNRTYASYQKALAAVKAYMRK